MLLSLDFAMLSLLVQLFFLLKLRGVTEWFNACVVCQIYQSFFHSPVFMVAATYQFDISVWLTGKIVSLKNLLQKMKKIKKFAAISSIACTCLTIRTMLLRGDKVVLWKPIIRLRRVITLIETEDVKRKVAAQYVNETRFGRVGDRRQTKQTFERLISPSCTLISADKLTLAKFYGVQLEAWVMHRFIMRK